MVGPVLSENYPFDYGNAELSVTLIIVWGGLAPCVLQADEI